MDSDHLNINLSKEKKKIRENNLAELNILVWVSESFDACQD